ncbi:MAG: hypothetical protein KUG77_30480 [Nannocystaceae bacterium]|nr:hypothetical protein [Nannocystaceae bacterium]
MGDFASPTTKVTVDPNPRRYDLPPHAELMRALFEQDKLARALVGENNLSIEARPLYEHIKAAVELKGAFGLVEQQANAAEERLAEYIVQSEEAEPKPRVLAQGVERTHGYALAQGGVLLLVDAPILENPSSDRVRLEWTQETRAWVQDLKSGVRTRCEAADRLRPGGVAVHAGGSTLVTQWNAAELMVFTTDPEQPGCSLRRAGIIALGDGPWGRANAAGKIVRGARVEGGLAAEIHTPDSPHAQTWPLVGCTAVSTPVWIDDTHIATSCEYEPPPPVDEEPGESDVDTEPSPPAIPEQRWLYVLSIEDGSVLALPLNEGARSNAGVWLRPGSAGLTLLTSSSSAVTAHAFETDVAGLFAAPPLDPERPRPRFVKDDASGVLALRTNAVASTRLPFKNTGRPFVVSPGGERVVFAVDGVGRFDPNLAVYEFATGKTRRIAINAWARHAEPSFSPDGLTIVFNSMYSTKGYGEATVSQAVPLRPGS